MDTLFVTIRGYSGTIIRADATIVELAELGNVNKLVVSYNIVLLAEDSTEISLTCVRPTEITRN